MSLTQPILMACPLTVGREAELATLEQLLALAMNGQGQAVLIEGEAGVGKSRLVTETVACATALGVAVLQGSCFEQDRALPYAGLIDLLRTQLPPLPAPAATPSLGPLAPLLLSLLPEYAALLPQSPALAALDAQQEHQRMTQAFLQFVAERARRTPLLLVIEDRHWADEATMAVLLALARCTPTFPLLLLLTLRVEQRSPSSTDFVTTLGRERRFDFELLQRLTGLDELALLAQLKELIAARLVVEEAPGRFAFRHALTRAALSAALLARERRALHHAIAVALGALAQEHGPKAVEVRAADLAHHFFAARDWAQVLRYASQAAALARRRYAPAAAAEQLTQAIAASRELGLPPPTGLLRERAQLQETLGAADEALADYHASLAEARAQGDHREESLYPLGPIPGNATPGAIFRELPHNHCTVSGSVRSE